MTSMNMVWIVMICAELLYSFIFSESEYSRQTQIFNMLITSVLLPFGVCMCVYVYLGTCVCVCV